MGRRAGRSPPRSASVHGHTAALLRRRGGQLQHEKAGCAPGAVVGGYIRLAAATHPWPRPGGL
eukprot:1340849-Pyramimonas_sp.AAC.1